jgi:hypothetical protein
MIEAILWTRSSSSRKANRRFVAIVHTDFFRNYSAGLRRAGTRARFPAYRDAIGSRGRQYHDEATRVSRLLGAPTRVTDGGEACFANRGKAKTNYDRWQHH